MTLPRLAFALLALPLLVACESNQQPAPPATEAPAAETSPPAAAPGPAAQAELAPLFGTFAADLSWCGGEGDGFPVTISATRFEGRENICDITAITDRGDGSFAADLVCTAEGQTVEERLELVPIFAPTGEGLTIVYADRGGEATTLLRCS